MIIMTRTKVKNRTAKRITTSVSNVFAKKAGKPKKKELGKPPKELEKLGRSIGKMTTTVTKLKSDIKGVDSTIKKLRKREKGMKFGRIPARIESLTKKLNKTLAVLEELDTAMYWE